MMKTGTQKLVKDMTFQEVMSEFAKMMARVDWSKFSAGLTAAEYSRLISLHNRVIDNK